LNKNASLILVFLKEKKEKTDFIKENQFSAPEKEQKRREV